MARCGTSLDAIAGRAWAGSGRVLLLLQHDEVDTAIFSACRSERRSSSTTHERLLMNVRAGTQDRNGMLMYYVPLQPGMYKTFGTLFDAFWCCTGTGSEEYSKLNDSIYFHDDDSVFVNLFIPSTLGLARKRAETAPGDQVPLRRPHHIHNRECPFRFNRDKDSHSLLGQRGRPVQPEWRTAG